MLLEKDNLFNIIPSKIIVFILLVLIFSSTLGAENSNNLYNKSLAAFDDFFIARRIIFGDKDQLDKIIPDLSLSILNKNELSILRNCVYAKHGYVFNSEKLKAYFSKFNWYKPEYKNVDKFLTETDRTNIEHIKKYENIRNRDFSPAENPFADFSGIVWHKSKIVAAGYDDSFFFYTDGTVSFRFNENDRKKTFIGFDGNFSVSSDTLRIEVKKLYLDEIFLDFNQFEGIGIETLDFMESRPIILILQEPLILYFPFEKPEKIDFYDLRLNRISIGTTEYFNGNR